MSAPAGAARFGYSADTAFDEDLLAWLDVADVVFHETNFGAHTPYANLAALPQPLRDKLRLIHWPDGFDVEAWLLENNVCECAAVAVRACPDLARRAPVLMNGTVLSADGSWPAHV